MRLAVIDKDGTIVNVIVAPKSGADWQPPPNCTTRALKDDEIVDIATPPIDQRAQRKAALAAKETPLTPQEIQEALKLLLGG